MQYWPGDGYPDFVAQGTGDQHTINAAICAVKKGTYDGSDCVGMDETATGTVRLMVLFRGTHCSGIHTGGIGGLSLREP